MSCGAVGDLHRPVYLRAPPAIAWCRGMTSGPGYGAGSRPQLRSRRLCERLGIELPIPARADRRGLPARAEHRRHARGRNGRLRRASDGARRYRGLVCRRARQEWRSPLRIDSGRRISLALKSPGWGEGDGVDLHFPCWVDKPPDPDRG